MQPPPPCLFLCLRPRRGFHPLSRVTEWHHRVYVRGGDCVGNQAFVLSGPRNLGLSVSLFFWVRQACFETFAQGWTLTESARFTPRNQRMTLALEQAVRPGVGEMWGLWVFFVFFGGQECNLISTYCKIIIVVVPFLFFFFGYDTPSSLVYPVSRLHEWFRLLIIKTQGKLLQINLTSETLKIRRFCLHVRLSLSHTHTFPLLLNHLYNRCLLFYILSKHF